MVLPSFLRFAEQPETAWEMNGVNEYTPTCVRPTLGAWHPQTAMIQSTKIVSTMVLALSLLTLAAAQDEVHIDVDTAAKEGPYPPVWAFFGYDEPNYTYMKDGQKLLSELAALGPEPVYVRVHNLLTSGDGTPALKWGSTGAYSKDADGKPIYNWTIVDRIVETYLVRGMKPYMQIGFMPEAMSTHPQPYQHKWKPGGRASISTGWAYPPKDYAKWGELVHQWVKHS